MKIYTRTGDGGRTMFFGCGLVQKDDARIEAFGALDELNSVIGVAMCFITDEKLLKILARIQHELFQVGADLGGSKQGLGQGREIMPKVTKEHVEQLEKTIDELEDKLGMAEVFILPGGTQASAFLHLCRATTRRVERNLVRAKQALDINPEIIRYVNRLSDFLYVLARQANKELDIKEQQPIYKYFEREESGGEAREEGREVSRE